MGCPLSARVAAELEAWSREHLVPLGVRGAPASHLHVTLLFFAAVDDAMRDELISLVRGANWPSIELVPGEVFLTGRGAVAVDLTADLDLLDAFYEALGSKNWYSGNLAQAEVDRLFEERGRKFRAWRAMIQRQSPAEQSRFHRELRHAGGWPRNSFHVTLGRTRDRQLDGLPEKGPQIPILLDGVALFESKTLPTGAVYAVLARQTRDNSA